MPAAAKNTPAVSFIEDETFNYYVDNIFTHLNEILHRDYDPVTVPLARSTGANKNVAFKARPSHRALDGKDEAEEEEERKVATKQSQSQFQTTTESQLFGLSTLKRIGNVKISRKSADDQAQEEDFTTIKSNFKLGPLTLKVQKITTRPGQKNYKKVRSATATTAEMLGRVNLRVKNGVASLYSIKVQQPKQVIGTTQPIAGFWTRTKWRQRQNQDVEPLTDRWHWSNAPVSPFVLIYVNVHRMQIDN